jgi:hypothetical protein
MLEEFNIKPLFHPFMGHLRIVATLNGGPSVTETLTVPDIPVESEWYKIVWKKNHSVDVNLPNGQRLRVTWILARTPSLPGKTRGRPPKTSS